MVTESIKKPLIALYPKLPPLAVGIETVRIKDQLIQTCQQWNPSGVAVATLNEGEQRIHSPPTR